MCAGLVIAQLFAEAHSFRNDRIFPAANFQFVAVRIFKEKCVVAGAVTYADFRYFQSFPASFAHQFRDAVHFFPRIGPECDPCSIWPMIFICGETEEFRGLVAARGIKSMEIVARTFVNKAELGQEFPVKPSCDFHVFHPYIDVIKTTCSHFLRCALHLNPLSAPPGCDPGDDAKRLVRGLDFRCSRRTINFNPDQVSSTAHTFTSTNPSGSATARITSSVTSVGTPADFFGQETQTVHVSGTFIRNRLNCFSSSPRRVVKR